MIRPKLVLRPSDSHLIAKEIIATQGVGGGEKWSIIYIFLKIRSLLASEKSKANNVENKGTKDISNEGHGRKI